MISHFFQKKVGKILVRFLEGHIKKYHPKKYIWKQHPQAVSNPTTSTYAIHLLFFVGPGVDPMKNPNLDAAEMLKTAYSYHSFRSRKKELEGFLPPKHLWFSTWVLEEKSQEN